MQCSVDLTGPQDTLAGLDDPGTIRLIRWGRPGNGDGRYSHFINTNGRESGAGQGHKNTGSL